uniref:Uncharacterized protein n=1 Tax=Tanacetum cinerariifolium TaxID=118510 RepID=A0A6L2LGI5_TANCI|nr:hypothetical protein [Tanacetum cinerariifolium]
MEHQDDLMNFIPPSPYDSPLSRGHTPGRRNLRTRPMFEESDFIPMDSEVVNDSGKKDESSSKKAGIRKK